MLLLNWMSNRSFQRVAVFGLLPFFLSGQSFDVASVKRITESVQVGKISRTGGTLRMRGVTLGWAIRWAYGLQQFQLSGPDWINWHSSNDQPRYDVMAKSSSSSSSSEIRLALQKLLAERFGLKVHWEQKTLDAIVLKPGQRWAMTFIDSPGDQPEFYYPSRHEYEVHNSTMAELCDMLSESFHTPFVDASELGETRFDASLRISEDVSTMPEWIDAVVEAMRKGLGAAIGRVKWPVKVLVVDSALQTPTAN